MMILAYYVFVGLLSSTSGQTPPVLTISNNYVIKPGNVTITCTVVGNISDTVVISKDGRNIFRCLTPAIPCSNLGNVSAYSTFQNETAGTTTMRINASEISRDAGNWACRYGTTSTSAPVSLAVVTPPPSRRLIEESGYIILELNCTYPNSSLGLTFYLGPARYTEGSLVESSVPCNAPEASLNYTLKFPSQHSGSYNGTFIVSVNNGFYNISINGGTLYTFSNSTSKTRNGSGSPDDDTTGKIAGGVVGGVGCAGCAAAGGTYAYKRYKNKKKNRSSGQPTDEEADTENGESEKDAKNTAQEKDKDSKRETDAKEHIIEGSVTPEESKTKKTLLAIHTGTQNKVVSETTSVQTNTSIQRQPLPPVGGVVEDKPYSCPQPPPPENSDFKDQNLKGLSANYDDTRGLATETPQSRRLLPLPPIQPSVEEKVASEEPKKKKKKKKKNDQHNEGNSEEMTEL